MGMTRILMIIDSIGGPVPTFLWLIVVNTGSKWLIIVDHD